MRSLLVFVVMCFAMLVFQVPSYAGFWDFFRIDRGSVKVQNDDVHAEVDFGYKERRAIQRYYRKGREKHRDKHHKKHRTKGLPPGLAKRKHLPPGLAKKDHLPPGLEKRLRVGQRLPDDIIWEYLPESLEQELKPLPKNYIRIKVGGTVVIFNEPTRVILDIIRDLE